VFVVPFDKIPYSLAYTCFVAIRAGWFNVPLNITINSYGYACCMVIAFEMYLSECLNMLVMCVVYLCTCS
jgi:hypothetical protein